MTTHSNRSTSNTRESVEEERAWEENSVFLSYAKLIGDPDSLWLLPETEGQLWAMRCPLRVHPGKPRTFLLDRISHDWWCTACETHGDMVDLAARLNRFNREDAEEVISIYLERTVWNAP